MRIVGPEFGRGLTPPIATAILICCVAPFWGDVQELLKGSLGSGFAPVFGLAFVASAGGLLFLVFRKIRERRLARYSLLALALLMAALQIVSTDRGFAEIPERLHLPLYGLLSFLFYRAWKAPERQLGRWAGLATILSVGVVGLLDEWVQTVVVARTGELYDVSLNLFAGVLGLLVAFAYFDFEGLSGPGTRQPFVIRTLATLILLATLAFATLFQFAHAGYRIDDPEIGTFFSYVHPDDTARLNGKKQSLWARHPPGPDWRPLELQDNFRIEAGWRVQHRNARHEAEDWFSAWREHRILERYFPAFLATPNRRGDTYDLSDEQVETLRKNARDDGRDYLSPAGIEPKRIFARPNKNQLWTAVAVVAFGCLVAMTLASRSITASSVGPG